MGDSRENAIWMWALWIGTKYTIRGKVMAFPKFGRDESCESTFAHGLSQHQKCLNYAITNLLFVLCRSMWMIKCLSFLLVPSWSSNMPLYPRSAMSQGMCLDSLLFRCFHFRFTFEFIKELGNVSFNLEWLYDNCNLKFYHMKIQHMKPKVIHLKPTMMHNHY